MRKSIAIFLCVIALLTFSSCGYSDKKQERIIEMFDSFGYSPNCVFLTWDDLVIGETHYERDQFSYQDKGCEIVFLDDPGFYSYTYDPEQLTVEFLLTDYQTFDVTFLGSATLPSEIIRAFFYDDCFWFRTDDPENDEFGQLYYTWNVNTQIATVMDCDDVTVDEGYMDHERSEDYSVSDSYGEARISVTCHQTGETKTINSSVLNDFAEGRKIRNALRANIFTTFTYITYFERQGDFYFVFYFEVGFLGYPCCYYVVKWNFETEESSYYSSVFYETYPNSFTDFYVLNENKNFYE